MHDYYWAGNGWGGWMMLHAGFWIVLLVLVAFVIFALSRGQGRRNGKASSALDVLNERYARGENDRDEYLQRRQDILEKHD
jgi:putative membrane protein